VKPPLETLPEETLSKLLGSEVSNKVLLLGTLGFCFPVPLEGLLIYGVMTAYTETTNREMDRQVN